MDIFSRARPSEINLNRQSRAGSSWQKTSLEYLTKRVHQYAGLEDGSVHTLDFLFLVLGGAERKFLPRVRFETTVACVIRPL